MPQDSSESMGKVGFVSNKGTKKAPFDQRFFGGIKENNQIGMPNKGDFLPSESKRW